MIFVDDNTIKVGSTVLPGLYKGLDIEGSVILEEVKVEGAKKIPKQAVGYEDHKITLRIECCDSENQSRWDKMQVIQNLFKEPSEDKPKPYDFINEHTQIRGISKVIFKKLSTSESSRNEAILLSLEFVEYEAIKISASSGSTNRKSSGKKKPVDPRKSAAAPVATKAYQQYLSDRGKSPSIDNRKPRRLGGHSEY